VPTCGWIQKKSAVTSKYLIELANPFNESMIFLPPVGSLTWQESADSAPRLFFESGPKQGIEPKRFQTSCKTHRYLTYQIMTRLPTESAYIPKSLTTGIVPVDVELEGAALLALSR
jgi:hypothetical protein